MTSEPPPLPPSRPHLDLHADLPAGMQVRVSVEGRAADGSPLERKQVVLEGEGLSRQIELELAAQTGLRSRLARSWRTHGAIWLLVGALVVYLFTRLYALADYPIYFFTDEANQTLLADDFLRAGLKNEVGDFLPTYFKNVYQYNLSLSVYLQVLPAILFPRSIEITRGISALVTLLAPLWLGLALLRVYRSPAPWLGVLLLTITPAWFLHSRTAFECSLGVTFYAGMLYYYLRYRAGSSRAVYGAVLCAALAFYSYSPAEVVVAVTLILWGVSDLRFHWQKRGLLLRAAVLGLLCLLPYARFQLMHPTETFHHLTQLGSVFNLPVPWTEKLSLYFQQYLHGLSPVFWYAPGQDIPRHIMGDFGNLLIFTFPLGIAAVGLAAWRWRRWEYRIPLLAVLAVPSGAALVGIGVTRTLFMVIPMALLTALVSGKLLAWATRRWHINLRFLSAELWIAMAGFAIFLLYSALTFGPTWSTDYGLGGMQYGARQVFGAAQRYADDHPGAQVYVASSWANGTDLIARFLLPDSSPVAIEGIDHWLEQKQPLNDGMLIILPPEELERAQKSAKFSLIQVVDTLPWPDGRVGFYMVHLRYVDNIDQIMAAEFEDQRSLQTASLTVGGGPLLVKYSRLDMGQITDIFDGDLKTLMRTMAANPLELQIEFASPRRMTGLWMQIGGEASTLDVSADVAGSDQPSQWHLQVDNSPTPRPVEVDFEGELDVLRLDIHLKNTDSGEPAHVHLWELTFQ
jgi:hypothetical protein